MVGFVIGIFAAGWLITDLWSKYLNSPVVVTFQPFETTIDQIPFPAVTSKRAQFNKPFGITEVPVVHFLLKTFTLTHFEFFLNQVCNMNKVLRSKAEEFIALAQKNNSNPETLEARKNLFYVDHVCSSSKSFSKRFNYSLSRGTIGSDILGMVQIRDGDDEQSDVASFLKRVGSI